MGKEVFTYAFFVFSAAFVVLAILSFSSAIKRSAKVIRWSVQIGAFACLNLSAVAMLAPVFISAKLSSQRSAALSHVREVGLVALMYGADNGDRMPLVSNWKETLQQYWNVDGSPIDAHPITGKEHWIKFKTVLSGGSFPNLQDPTRTVMFAGGIDGPEGKDTMIIVVFCDGSVKAIKPQKFSWGTRETLFERETRPPDPRP